MTLSLALVFLCVATALTVKKLEKHSIRQIKFPLKLRNSVERQIKSQLNFKKFVYRQIKFPLNLKKFVNRQIKFPPNMPILPTAKLNSRQNFFP